MAEDMVERVARALAPWFVGTDHGCDGTALWARVSMTGGWEPCRDDCPCLSVGRAAAEDAIAAMREPADAALNPEPNGE